MHIEQVKAKAQQLKGTGGGEALAAVLEAVDMLTDRARGRLDSKNRELAAMALLEALTAPGRPLPTLNMPEQPQPRIVSACTSFAGKA